MVTGLGSGGNSVHKEIYKATKLMLTDRVMAVRCAACSVSVLDAFPFIFMIIHFVLVYGSISPRSDFRLDARIRHCGSRLFQSFGGFELRCEMCSSEIARSSVGSRP